MRESLPALAAVTKALTALIKADTLAGSEREVETPLRCAQWLHEHGVFFGLADQGEEGRNVQEMIGALGEQWWKLGRHGANMLILTIVPYLLLKSFDERATRADVKRVHALRESLTLFDLGDASCDELKSWLATCFVMPNYLGTAEGQSFLVSASGFGSESLVLWVFGSLGLRIFGSLGL